LVRYNANGTLDTSFGTGGKVTTDINTRGDWLPSITIQSDGKLLAAGMARMASTNIDDFGLVRYNTDGTLDTTFGIGGKVTTDVGGSWDQGFSVSVQPDGKIVVSGFARFGSNDDFAVVRYNTDGSLDTTFDRAGTLGGSVSYAENSSPVVLDSDVRVFDAELGGGSNFNNASLTLVRNGGANGQDLFSATGTLGALTQGGNLTVGGTTIGTVTTNSSGSLVLTFNSSATNTLVNSTMQQIAYANSGNALPASVQIDWTFNDGNSAAQGTGGALTATGNVVVNMSRIVMQWKLDDTGSGSYVGQDSTQRSTISVSDASSHGIDGSMINMDGTEWVDGRTGGALDFNGVNAAAYDYVVSNVALNLVPTKYTVAFWVKADATGYWNPIFGEEGPTTSMTGPDWGNFLFHSGPSGQVYMGQYGSNRFSLAPGTLAVGSWTHFAMTFDNGSARAYVNGTLMGTQTGWAYGSTWSQFYLGGPQSWEGTDAKLDDIRIYDGALSTSDIRMIANPPLLGAIESTSAAYTESGSAVSLTSALTLSDVDNGSMSSATIAIVRNRTVGDVLTYTNQNGINGAYNSNTGVLTLSGISSSANYQAALRSVQFSSTSDDPTAGGSVSTRTIAFLVNDGQLDSNPVRRVVDVTPLNDTPVAVSDSTIAIERGGSPDGSVGLDPTGNVFTNDTDVDSGDSRTVTGVAAGVFGSASTNVGSAVVGTYGSINISSTGAYTYTVDNSNATVQALRTSSNTLSDVFTYTMQDSGGLTSTTQITVTIQGANDAPVGVNDTATAVEAGGVNNSGIGFQPVGNVLTNDTDVDAGDTKTVNAVAAGSLANASGYENNVGTSVTGMYGGITINADGSYQYTFDNSNSTVQSLRTSSDTLQDVFTYTMRDIDGVTSTTQVTITIQGSNDTPFDIVGGGLTVDENTTNGTVIGSVLGQDIDSGDAFTYNLLNSAGGRFTIDNAGQITVANRLLLNRENDATHTITVQVVDAAGAAFSKNFVIAINDVDEFDVTRAADTDNTSNRVDENAPTGTVVGLTAFATDDDATTNTVSYSLADDAGGSFAIDSATGLLLTAKSLNYEATASLTVIVRATSSDGSFSVATEVIEILNVFEAPIGTNDPFSTSYIDKLNVITTGVLSNDVDPDGDSITAVLVSGPSSGQVVFLSNGWFSYTPVPGFLGTVDIVYQAFDGLLFSEPITISIDVLLPDNLPGDNGGSSTSNSSNNSGTEDGGSTTSTSNETADPVPIGGIEQTVQATDQAPQEVMVVSEAVGETTVSAAFVLALAEEKKELALATFMEIPSRSYSQSHVGYDMMRRRGGEYHFKTHKSDNEDLLDYSSTSKKEIDELIDAKSSSFESMVFSTVVGTGMLLWVVQGAQLAATLISVATAWIHLDTLAVLNNADGKLKKEELSASERLFE
jgi:uncharacterized delta-60 repeat protein